MSNNYLFNTFQEPCNTLEILCESIEDLLCDYDQFSLNESETLLLGSGEKTKNNIKELLKKAWIALKELWMKIGNILDEMIKKPLGQNIIM